MKKVLLATPMMPPTPGGPATHAKKLIDYFGFQLFNFEKYKKFPSGIRHLFAFLDIFYHSLNKDIILALDGFTVAWPSIFVKLLTGKKVVLRVGGDFVYENFLYTKEVDYESYYNNFEANKKLMSTKLYLKYLAQKFLVQQATGVIFNTNWQKDIFLKHYKLNPNKVFVILNPIEPIPENIYKDEKYENDSKYIFTSITRDIPYKNQSRVKKVFDGLMTPPSPPLLRGGIVPYFEHKQGSWESCLKRISVSRAYICASISDISPNQVLEAIALKIPIILTKYSGITENLKNEKFVKIVDPFSEEEIKKAILEMCDNIIYKDCKTGYENFSWPQNWSTLFKQYEQIINEI